MSIAAQQLKQTTLQHIMPANVTDKDEKKHYAASYSVNERKRFFFVLFLFFFHLLNYFNKIPKHKYVTNTISQENVLIRVKD